MEIEHRRDKARGQDLPGGLASSCAFDRGLIQFELDIHKTEHLLPTFKEEIVS